MKVAVFIERDGVLNHARLEHGHVRPPQRLEDLQIHEELAAPLKSLKSAGFLLFATTNQPGVSGGTISRRELELMHAVLLRKFELDGVLVCPHAPEDNCPCRKPRPGLLTEAAFEHHLRLERCFVISDKWQDAEMAELAGATSLLIRSELNGSAHHDCIVADFPNAVRRVLDLAGISGALKHLARAGQKISRISSRRRTTKTGRTRA